MSTDPIFLLSKQRMITASAQIEAELIAGGTSGPTMLICRELRRRAADSLTKLVFADLWTREGREKAIALQNEVKRYDEWLAAMKDILEAGRAADDEMRAEEREELLDYLVATPEGQQQAIELGLADNATRD